MGINLLATFKKGGWAMWPLLIFLILALTFIFERVIVLLFQRRKLKPDEFLTAFEKSMKDNGGDKDKVVEEMTALCRKKGGACAEIMMEGLEKFKQGKALRMDVMQMKQWMTGAIEERSRIELPQLESHLTVLSVVAGVAPLMGLLGTVSGMIRSFTVMAGSAGGAKPAELAGGISEALITTATGLIIAIPVLIAFNALKSSVENFVMLVEEAAIHLVDALILDTAPPKE